MTMMTTTRITKIYASYNVLGDINYPPPLTPLFARVAATIAKVVAELVAFSFALFFIIVILLHSDLQSYLRGG